MADVNLNKVFNFYDEVPVSESLKPCISKNENIAFAVKTVRDVAVFTDKRILVADKQGVTGKKIELKFFKSKNMDQCLLRVYDLINSFVTG